MNTWRTYLFVPAKDLSIIRKAVVSSSDSVIIDLEDAVALSEKENARDIVKRALLEFNEVKPIYIRINDISTVFWEEDLAAAVRNGAKGIIIPKSESKDGTIKICNKVREIAKELGRIEEKNFEVIPLLETARGIQFAFDIADADPLITHLSFGSIDFSLDIGCELTNDGDELLFARSAIVIASKAAGIGNPIDAVYPNLTNSEGLKQETERAKQLGFKGKLIIHPKQINSVHRVFSPNEKELLEAKAIVEGFEKAEEQGLASIAINNKLVDYPVYKKAKQILKENSVRES